MGNLVTIKDGDTFFSFNPDKIIRVMWEPEHAFITLSDGAVMRVEGTGDDLERFRLMLTAQEMFFTRIELTRN